MLKNFLKIAWRNLGRSRVFSFINIGGLAVGMAVAILIGLWIYDEVTFNHYHENHARIAKVWQRETFNGEVGTFDYLPFPLAPALQATYADDFTSIATSTFTAEHILAFGDRHFTVNGNYMEPAAPKMLTLHMVHGSINGLADPSSIMLSASVAKALFGNANPLHQVLKIDNKLSVSVTGVYDDIPQNSDLNDVHFIAPWALYLSSEPWVKNLKSQWDYNIWQIYVQLKPNADFNTVSAKIKNIKVVHDASTAKFKPEVFLHPMDKWHLFSGWDKKGLQADGRIQYVWLFGIIGFFVLLLACINFMNLSTARSEKRAKEVGIRKTVGSMRWQLVAQFFSESLLVVVFAFLLSLIMVQLVLPWFNAVADKKMVVPFSQPVFWLSGIAFCVFTGLIAGSYPALYLSAFRPVKVLKGTFRFGRFAVLPRKILVVIQFTASVTLIIGTITVFRQIQYARDRPVGYSRDGLIAVSMNTPELYGHYDALRNALLNTGAVLNMSTSSSPTTNVNASYGGFNWEGRDPNLQSNFGTIGVTHDFGKTVGWQFVKGRDFSRAFATDSLGIILNETAAKYIGLRDPVGKILQWNEKKYTIIGVIKDMVMDSPYDPIYQTVFVLNYDWAHVINIKMNPHMGAGQALEKMAAVFQQYNPASPFDFKFADNEYARKFASEERVGKLAGFFAVLAIFISCLGLFGLATFVAEQRTKEIGVRKVLGASVFNLWKMLSRDFVVLVVLSCWIAVPIAYHYMQLWLMKFNYHAEVSWWIFASAGAGALLITLFTVSYQAVTAALMNPVKSLRSE